MYLGNPGFHRLLLKVEHVFLQGKCITILPIHKLPFVCQTSSLNPLLLHICNHLHSYHLHLHLSYLHPTVTNVNSPMVAGGDCSVMVSPSSITTATTEQWPFKLHFVVRNISRCAGCTGRYNKPSLPPDNLCVQHKEWGQINFPNLPSPSTRFSNAYYHLNLRCICSNWPHFIPSDLVILPSMCAALQPEHRDILRDLGFQP